MVKTIRYLIVVIWCSIVWCLPLHAQEVIRYNGSSTILTGFMYQAAQVFQEYEGVAFDLKGENTRVGIQKLLAEECDIAGGGRPLTDDEKAQGLVETKAFLDGYAFIVYPSNPVEILTSTQLSDILTGTLTEWDTVGGPAGKKIIIISPPQTSVHYAQAKTFFGFSELPKHTITVDMTPYVYDKVKIFPVSLGWLSYANVAKKDDVSILQIVHHGQTVALNQANLVTGAYPYQQTMYFYTMGTPTGPVQKFIDFIFSDRGGELITEAGFFRIK